MLDDLICWFFFNFFLLFSSYFQQVFPTLIEFFYFYFCTFFSFFWHASRIYFPREFLNSVWCIKVLSPQEMHQMSEHDSELLNSIPIQRLSNNSCDDHVNQNGSRNLRTRIWSEGSIDYWNGKWVADMLQPPVICFPPWRVEIELQVLR